MTQSKQYLILKNANQFYQQGKISESISEYKKILSFNPNDIKVRRMVGGLLLRKEMVSEAVEQYQWIGDYFAKQGNISRAIATYKRIISIAVDDKNEFSLILADLYTKNGLTKNAKEIYLKLAGEYLYQNNRKKALEIYERIIELEENDNEIRNFMAEIYLDEAVDQYLIPVDSLIRNNQYQKSEQILLSILSKVKNIRIYDKLLLCYIKMGMIKETIDLFEDLMKNYNNHLDILDKLNKKQLLTLYEYIPENNNDTRMVKIKDTLKELLKDIFQTHKNKIDKLFFNDLDEGNKDNTKSGIPSTNHNISNYAEFSESFSDDQDDLYRIDLE